MKKFIFLIFIAFVYSFSTNAQTDTSTQAKHKPITFKDYTVKSKHQRTAARILLFGGAGVTLTAFVVAMSNANKTWWGILDEDVNTTTEDVLLVVGNASMLGSIPLFIAASKNRRKAQKLQVSIDIQKDQRIVSTAFKTYHYPVVKLTLPLR
jgi:hypothetical protein